MHKGNVYGTYLHGFFDSPGIAGTVVSALLRQKGLDDSDVQAFDMQAFKERQYDLLADGLRQALDMRAIYEIVERGLPPAQETEKAGALF